MDLSVVLPAYCAEEFIAGRLGVLADYLQVVGLTYEILVVDDGSTDGTASAVTALQRRHVRLIRLASNRGKFGALKAGIARARGRCCVVLDADVPYEPCAIGYMARQVLERRFHVVVGDRTLPGSRYGEEQTLLRRLLTRLFSLLVRLFHTAGVADTQCGIKAFRQDVASELFPLLHEERFAGDLELLYIALKYNLEVKRVPVRLVYQGRSSVHPFRDGPRLCLALALVRVRYALGRYENSCLTKLMLQDYWNDRGPATIPPARQRRARGQGLRGAGPVQGEPRDSSPTR